MAHGCGPSLVSVRALACFDRSTLYWTITLATNTTAVPYSNRTLRSTARELVVTTLACLCLSIRLRRAFGGQCHDFHVWSPPGAPSFDFW
eukprot:scaffold109582_cov63-Phaeocystis_antarctica.AAC.1